MKKENKQSTVSFGQWEVSSEGHLTCTERDYNISNWRLTKSNWILHLQSKGWVNLNDFIPAYFKALEIRGIDSVVIQTYYA